MVDRNRQLERIGLPQFLKNQLCQPARIAEYQRGFMGFNFGHHLIDRIFSRMPRPRHFAARQQDRNIGIRPCLADN